MNKINANVAKWTIMGNIERDEDLTIIISKDSGIHFIKNNLNDYDNDGYIIANTKQIKKDYLNYLKDNNLNYYYLGDYINKILFNI